MSFQVPDNTSTYKDEYKPDAYVIPVAPELVRFITDELKLTTYRFGNKYDYLKEGDEVGIQNAASKEIAGKALIKRKGKALFKDLPLSDGLHESYKDKEHQRQVLSGYYAYLGRPIADDDEFLVFEVGKG